MKTELIKFLDYSNCPVRHVLDRFGDKWSVLILVLLNQEGKLRFNEISGQINDISQKMLTVTLRSLEADGLVTRKLFPEVPPRVEYDLTALGKSLVPYVESLAEWASEHMSDILKNRKKYISRQKAA